MNIQKRLKLYQQALDDFKNGYILFRGFCEYFDKKHNLCVYNDYLFRKTLPELYYYRPNYGKIYWFRPRYNIPRIILLKKAIKLTKLRITLKRKANENR